MNYPDSVRFLYSLGNEIKTAKFGLERIGTLLDALGNPERRLHAVHVAGTNGKGSVCAMLEAALRHAGRRTGLYTSPHLHEPTERIRIDGRAVSRERFTAAFDRVHEIAEDLQRSGAIDLHPTYFETVTAMAFLLFAEEPLDCVVLETGLGGRLDATNVIAPELCVITPVDFDHERFLGSSLEGIAAEKAGILKAGVPAVFARQRAEAAGTLDARAAELDIPVTHAEDWWIRNITLSAAGSHFHLAGELDLDLTCPLAGEHQVENAATAAIALARLGLTRAEIENGIAQTRWPGRLERLAEAPAIIVDGAHNPAGARALAAYLDCFYSGRKVTLIIGAMRDKAVAEITGLLFPRAARVIATAPRQERALAPASLLATSAHTDASTAASLAEALELARGGEPEAIVITGSLFLVAEARELLGAPLL